jgi:hypothetical protein
MDERALEYPRRLCERSGGGMFEIEIGAFAACAIAEYMPGGALIARELLVPGGDTALFVSALLDALPSPTVSVFAPARQGGAAPRFGMINTASPRPPPPTGRDGPAVV